MIWSGFLVLPLAADWSAQEFFGKSSNNTRRLFTGILGGLGVGIVVWSLVAWIGSYLLSLFGKF